MKPEERINAFAQLGEKLRNLLSGKGNVSSFEKVVESQQVLNPWFTTANVRMAISAIANELTETNLQKWMSAYPEVRYNSNPLKVAVIMAGNIPLAGFQDYISVLITGNRLVAKTSSKDQELIVYIHDILCGINPDFRDPAEFTTGTLAGFDAVIATGSDNSSRYFEYYFGRYPNIIRRNRNSIAILEGNETGDQLKDLAVDIFTYFGLGCRNISKIFIPKGYNLTKIAENWDHYSNIASHPKYANNYDFNKAVYLVNRETFYDTGYLLMKEDQRISSPVSVLYYEYYESIDAVKQLSVLLKDKIQCIVGRNDIPFGKAQCPHLWDYADGIDVVDFLLKKNLAGIL